MDRAAVRGFGGAGERLRLVSRQGQWQTGPMIASFRNAPARLERRGGALQLVVGGEPFLMLAGELGNSSASAAHVLDAIWPRLSELQLNTVLIPVYWELIEPREGDFDFRSLDAAIEGAARFGLRLVPLWFGSYKNGMSSYVPAWVKRDHRRFPRARLASGQALEVLSAFAESNREADARALSRVCAHLRDHDQRRTAILLQVENEVAMIGSAREHGPLADAAFDAPVPEALLAALATRWGPTELALQAWQARGKLAEGTWSQIFGSGYASEELFMAWHYARYVDGVAAAAKSEYPLATYTNAALNAAGKLPGEYPSAGPLPHLLGVWKLAAPHLDFLAPDIYFDDFASWCSRYDRNDNPLFVPEARRGAEAAANALYAIGEHAALGFSPFAVDKPGDPGAALLRQTYAVLARLAPKLLAHQETKGRPRPSLRGVLLGGDRLRAELALGPFDLIVVHEDTWRWSQGYGRGEKPKAGALCFISGPNELVIFGFGLLITFADGGSSQQIGIESVEVGRFAGGELVFDHRLNGDQTHQGRHVHLPYGASTLVRARLYRYE